MFPACLPILMRMGNRVEAFEVTAEQDSIWDQFVLSSAQGGDFLKTDVLFSLSKNEIPAAKVIRLALASPDQPDLFLAGWAFLVRKRYGVSYNSSFPLFYCGPCLAPPLDGPDGSASKRLDLINQLAEEAKKYMDVIDCESHPSLTDPRGLLYAGYHVSCKTCHVWKPTGESSFKHLNKTKRNEANRAKRSHTFDWVPVSQESIDRFSKLHDSTLDKFSWHAPQEWRNALANHTLTMGEMGVCRLFASMPENSVAPDSMVSVLLNHAHKTAFLWRVGFSSDETGLIPALYASATDAVREEFGSDWTINFGGSPRLSLSRYKDYLGADVVGHHGISYQRPGRPWLIWNGGYAVKEWHQIHRAIRQARRQRKR